jgi:hypothetical protein
MGDDGGQDDGGQTKSTLSPRVLSRLSLGYVSSVPLGPPSAPLIPGTSPASSLLWSTIHTPPCHCRTTSCLLPRVLWTARPVFWSNSQETQWRNFLDWRRIGCRTGRTELYHLARRQPGNSSMAIRTARLQSFAPLRFWSRPSESFCWGASPTRSPTPAPS